MSAISAPTRKLIPGLSMLGAWAFAIGTSVGWGSLVVTSNTYLAQAGPAGSVIGLLIGALIMLIISRNYAYMANAYPEAGGAYAYSREVFGCDHGFLTAWFLALTYLAILWANATSLPLFSRYFLGDLFAFGRLYTLFGYDVYLGEALLSIAATLLISLLCARCKRLSIGLMTVLALIFTAGIVICCVGGMLRRGQALFPAYIPDKNALSQIVKIACISPWAFIGFESISHAAEEFTFKRSRFFRVLFIAVLSATALYVCVTLLSVAAYPPEYDNWLDYIRDLPHLDGLKGLPAFYAAYSTLGSAGVTILMLSLLALIVTSLIGNITALSRLFYAMAKDKILPGRFAGINAQGVPGQAVALIAGVSCLIPFVGRTAVGWIVDVTTIGATLIYGFVSAAAMKLARESGDKGACRTGVAGLVLMIGFGLYLLIPNLFTDGSMATETFFLFVIWAVLGFVYFRVILRHDKDRRFGRSIIVWIALLSLILFVSLVWMSQSTMHANDSALQKVVTEAGLTEAQSAVVEQEKLEFRQTNARSLVVVICLFGLSLGVLLNNYNMMSRRALESEAALGHVRDLANTDPLTGVKSKHAFVEAEKDADGRIRDGTAEPFAVGVCDVNGLKFVNDTLGHKAGDEYIRAASRMICEIFQHSPVFRIGGDEFVILLSGMDFENRGALCARLDRTSVEHIGTGEVIVSIGLSDFQPGSDMSLHGVFERADALMYRRKQELKGLGARTR